MVSFFWPRVFKSNGSLCFKNFYKGVFVTLLAILYLLKDGFDQRQSGSHNQKCRAYHLVKTAFWFLPTTPSRKFHLWSSKNQIAGVRNRSGTTKPITNVHCDWFILPLLPPTATMWFSLVHKWNVSDGV